jgi:hypothetical protein
VAPARVRPAHSGRALPGWRSPTGTGTAVRRLKQAAQNPAKADIARERSVSLSVLPWFSRAGSVLCRCSSAKEPPRAGQGHPAGPREMRSAGGRAARQAGLVASARAGAIGGWCGRRCSGIVAVCERSSGASLWLGGPRPGEPLNMTLASVNPGAVSAASRAQRRGGPAIVTARRALRSVTMPMQREATVGHDHILMI